MNSLRRRAAGFRTACLALCLLATVVFAPRPARAADAPAPATSIVRVVKDAAGARLQVDGHDYFVRGMNWDYIPIGQNYMFDLFSQPDDVIKSALDREMGLLHAMGVTAIRQYTGIPPRWVQFIYEKYGIWTMLNHPVGRYGFTIDGVWRPVTDYSDPKTRAALKADVAAQVARYRNTPGVLMWLLGNENNYGLSWSSFEIEALPKGERDAARARHLYSLYEEIIDATHAADAAHPVAIANGDLQYLDLIKTECPHLDVLGVNVYRGISVGDLFQRVHDALGVPVVFSEFGCDAFNARTNQEDQATQAKYLLGQWQEIYEQSSGKGRVGNAAGGFIFQFSDGWWKFGQDSRLDIHDTHASWPDGGYAEDYVKGENNMNEEWWGICGKGPADDHYLYDLYPRAAYYAMQRAFRLDPYAPGTDLKAIAEHFAAIDPVYSSLQARGDHATQLATLASRVRLSGLRLDFETIGTGGDRITTPEASAPQAAMPSFKGFDKMQSFYADVEAHPSDNVTGTISINVLGHVPTNPINEIFYEKRGRTRTVYMDGASAAMDGIERVKVYKAGVSWEDRYFQLDGFYRTGHYHWGYEGDFFGLYREANYGTNIDVYNADTPAGFEMTGKKQFEGLKFAYGQELWWGANPAIMAKYRHAFGRTTATAVFEGDVANQSAVSSSGAVPAPQSNKATLTLERAYGPVAFTAGGIWANANKAGETFQMVTGSPGNYVVRQDEIFKSDAFGAKAKMTWQVGKWNWYAQTARMGLVADAGPTQTITYTGWSLKDVGSGNQVNVISGLLVNEGSWAIAPNVLWQKPIVGPIPADAPSPALPRNISVRHDPFAVRSNRETVGAELLIGYDPTPATWMWAWDNDVREDAMFAASLDFVYRHLPTTQDAATYIGTDGVTQFAFPGATPKRDLWELRGRVVSATRNEQSAWKPLRTADECFLPWALRTLGRRLMPRRTVATWFVGDGEPNGENTRVVHRWGGDARFAWPALTFAGSAHFNDWGPYDYHRDFNLTFPMQLSGDFSRTLGAPRWFSAPQTSIGVRGTYRTLDANSPRYKPDTSGRNGDEWEFRTYLNFAI